MSARREEIMENIVSSMGKNDRRDQVKALAKDDGCNRAVCYSFIRCDSVNPADTQRRINSHFGQPIRQYLPCS